jgi:hypothetical protein
MELFAWGVSKGMALREAQSPAEQEEQLWLHSAMVNDLSAALAAHITPLLYSLFEENQGLLEILVGLHEQIALPNGGKCDIMLKHISQMRREIVLCENCCGFCDRIG